MSIGIQSVARSFIQSLLEMEAVVTYGAKSLYVEETPEQVFVFPLFNTFFPSSLGEVFGSMCVLEM